MPAVDPDDPDAARKSAYTSPPLVSNNTIIPGPPAAPAVSCILATLLSPVGVAFFRIQNMMDTSCLHISGASVNFAFPVDVLL